MQIEKSQDIELGGMKVSSVAHIAVAVPDLEMAMSFYHDRFGAKISAPTENTAQGVRIAFAEFSNTKIELLQPLNKVSPVGRFIERNPSGGIHHICFSTEDAELAHSTAEANGLRPLQMPEQGVHGHPLFFLHPKETFGALIEIEESG